MSERFCYVAERSPASIDDDIREWSDLGLRLEGPGAAAVTLLTPEGHEESVTHAEFREALERRESATFELWIDEAPDVIVARTTLAFGVEYVYWFLGLSDARISPIVDWALARFKRRALAHAAIVTAVELRSNTSPAEWRRLIEEGVVPAGAPYLVASESRLNAAFESLDIVEAFDGYSIKGRSA